MSKQATILAADLSRVSALESKEFVVTANDGDTTVFLRASDGTTVSATVSSKTDLKHFPKEAIVTLGDEGIVVVTSVVNVVPTQARRSSSPQIDMRGDL